MENVSRLVSALSTPLVESEESERQLCQRKDGEGNLTGWLSSAGATGIGRTNDILINCLTDLLLSTPMGRKEGMV
jgi:hypothetical protein